MDIDLATFIPYYKRQILVKSFGIEEQKKLQQSSCLIVGMGGLGCPIGLYLTTSGVGHIGICDYDNVEFSNLGRQILFSPNDVGKKKSSVAQKILQEKNPLIHVQEHKALLNEANIEEIISHYDLVLDCTDNFHSKYLIHDTCVHLKKNMIQGSLFQTQGQVIGFVFDDARSRGCMRCMWEQQPSALCVKSCAEAGILNLVAGTVALRQATTALQFLTHHYQNANISNLYSYVTQEWMNFPWPHKHDCIYCKRETPPITKEPLIIESMSDATWCILDVRNEEDQNDSFGSYSYINISNKQRESLSLLAQMLDENAHYVTVCYAGIRSIDIANAVRSLGHEKIHSYAGGYKQFLINEHITTA